jgi:hypothetical protein
MKEWFYWYFPIITTRRKRDDYTFRLIKDAEYNIHGRYEKFIARSVQGGLFMPLLMDRWTR